MLPNPLHRADIQAQFLLHLSDHRMFLSLSGLDCPAGKADFQRRSDIFAAADHQPLAILPPHGHGHAVNAAIGLDGSWGMSHGRTL